MKIIFSCPETNKLIERLWTWNQRSWCPFPCTHNDLIRGKLAACSITPFWAFVSSFSSPSLTLLLSFHSCHTHTPFLFLASFHVLLLLSLQSAFLQQAIGFTPATSILRVTAVVAHKARTLCCDVARCPTAALLNPVWSLCWLDWSVFTQAPRAQ